MGAETALSTSAPACKPAYRRLTDADRVYILRLSDQKLTQAEIAQRVGCTQQTVSDWLSKCQDTAKDASQYLRGQALHMARRVVSKGKPSDLVATLKGINVLEEQQLQTLSLTINGIMLNGLGGEAGKLLSPGSDVVEGETLQNQQQ